MGHEDAPKEVGRALNMITLISCGYNINTASVRCCPVQMNTVSAGLSNPMRPVFRIYPLERSERLHYMTNNLLVLSIRISMD